MSCLLAATQEPEFWTNMGRYARFAVGTGLGMFYTVARPLVDLLRKPTTAVPLVLGLVALTLLAIAGVARALRRRRRLPAFIAPTDR